MNALLMVVVTWVFVLLTTRSQAFTPLSSPKHPVVKSSLTSSSRNYQRQRQEEVEELAKRLVIHQLGYLPNNYVCVSAWKNKKIQKATKKKAVVSQPDDIYVEHVPIAIQTYPLNGGAKRRRTKALIAEPSSPAAVTQKETDTDTTASTSASTSIQSPFPTLFWLTCPEISRAISDLEGHGFIETIEEALRDSPSMRESLLRCHQEHSQMRWTSLSADDKHALSVGGRNVTSPLHRMHENIQTSGISGSVIMIRSDEMILRSDDRNSDLTAVTSGSEEELFPVPNVKCLHAHYAQYRSTVQPDDTEIMDSAVLQAPRFIQFAKVVKDKKFTVNPVGEMIHQELMSRYPDLCL